MKTLEEELNIIADEITLEQPNIQKMQEELLLPQQNKNRGERINIGASFLAQQNRIYSFIRFSKIADSSKFSDNAKKLHSTISDEVEKILPLIKNQDELPPEIKEFLNK